MIFRSPSLGVAGDVLSLDGRPPRPRLAGAARTRSSRSTFALLIAALLVFVNVAPNTWQIKLRPRVWQGVAAGVAAALAVMTISQPHPFIYFQF